MRLPLLLLAGLLAACDAPNVPRPAIRPIAAQDRDAISEAAGAWTPVGLQIQEVPQAAQTALGVAYGVMVTKVRAPANRSRILPGDVIVSVNQTQIRSVEEFNKLVAGQGAGTIGLLVRRAEADLYIALEVGNAAAGRNPGSDPEDASRGGGSPFPEEETFKGRRPRPATDKPLRT
jgi:membrane-associated protease RseP (regulator of RpoE activity)